MRKTVFADKIDYRELPGTGGLAEFNGFPGFLIPGDVQILFDLARHLPSGARIAEIGSFMGLSAIVMANGLIHSGNESAHIHCIDTWRGSDEHSWHPDVAADTLYERFLGHIAQAEVTDLVTPIRKPSVEAAGDFADASFDLVFVDGDHSYEGCLADLHAWLPKVKPGGWLIGHDCNPGGSVIAALRTFIQSTGLEATVIPPPEAHYLFKIAIKAAPAPPPALSPAALPKPAAAVPSVPKQGGEPSPDQPKRLLVASLVRQTPEILRWFLVSLATLAVPDGWRRDFLFLANGNTPASQNLLNVWALQHGATVWQRSIDLDYVRNDVTHEWPAQLIGRVGAFRDEILTHARQQGYDAVVLIDSDLILHPATLVQLQAADKPIVSEIFWTRWYPDGPLMPNVWYSDSYAMAPSHLKGQDYDQAAMTFLNRLHQPGLYPVGGLGACTWIGRAALEAGASYAPIANLSLTGEDRAFCVRAVVLGLPLYVDTHLPALHLYREEDLARIPAFVASWTPATVTS